MNADTLFPDFPPDARLWIYAADRPLSKADAAQVLDTLKPFLGRWASHSRPVRGRAAVAGGRFLLIAAMLEYGGDISGCGIDASVHAIEAATADAGITIASPLNVFFRHDDGSIEMLPRPAFRKLVRSGDVTAQTPVFDLSITTVSELHAGGFEKPAGEAWHATAFRIPQPA